MLRQLTPKTKPQTCLLTIRNNVLQPVYKNAMQRSLNYAHLSRTLTDRTETTYHESQEVTSNNSNGKSDNKLVEDKLLKQQGKI